MTEPTAAPAAAASRYAYLGPAGTFTEAALRALPEAANAAAADADALVAHASVAAALEAVRRGQVYAAMVPIENSVEGSVSATLDELAAGGPLLIVAEVLLPVSFALLVRPGTTTADIKTVAGHPHSQPQCRRWLASFLPDREWRPAASNADAARLVADGAFDAALAGVFAADRYGLQALAEEIHDVDGAVTRFVLVAAPRRPEPPTGTDKTSLVAFIRDDHPGALMEILDEFAVRGVNLTRIESRPTGSRLGRYSFSVDVEGHIADERVGEALKGLRRVCADVRFLGSYRRADGQAATVRHGAGDADFAAADRWLREIRRSGA